MLLFWQETETIVTPTNASKYVEDYIIQHNLESRLQQVYIDEIPDYELFLKDSELTKDDFSLTVYLIDEVCLDAGAIIENVILAHPKLQSPEMVVSVVWDDSKIVITFFTIEATNKQDLIDYIKLMNTGLKISAEDLLEAFI